MAESLVARHIQDHNAAGTTLKHYWAYGSRVMPCVNDAGTCAYLDAVYHMHTLSMLYTWILWGALLGIGVVWLFVRGWRMGGPAQRKHTFFDRGMDGLQYLRRRWLLQTTPATWLFGKVSRLQVLVLLVLTGYLAVFS